MKRINIIGNAGSGKTTLALCLAKRLSLPVIHLDQIFLKAGWAPINREEQVKRIQEIISQQDQWVIEGNYSATFKTRFSCCDIIIYIDKHPFICCLRVLLRSIRFLGRKRPTVGEHCIERLVEWSFYKWILSFRKKYHLIIIDAIKLYGWPKYRIIKDISDMEPLRDCWVKNLFKNII